MKVFLLLTSCLILSITAEEVRLLDLDPNEAAQLIENKDQSLKYAPKVDSNVPAVRVLGRDPHNVLEDIYLANQYHGQDGLGGYLYGYSVPDIAKTERKKAGGDLRGAYNYINGDGQEIKVQYWDDGTGFHQVDNVPQILPQQIDDTPEVKAAKAEHARLWQEEAERNSRPPVDPNANFGGSSSYQQYSNQGSTQYPRTPSAPQYPSAPFPQGQQFIASAGFGQQQPQPSQGQYQPQGQYQNQPSSQQGQYRPQGSYQGQSSSQPGQYQLQGQVSSQSGQYQPQGPYQDQVSSQPGQYQPQGQNQYQPQASSQQNQYQSSPSNANNVDYVGSYSEPGQAYAARPVVSHQPLVKSNQEEQEEPSGPPRGFFYSFDYPVGIITQDQGKLLQKREEINDLYDRKKTALEQQLKQHGDYRVRRAVLVYA